MPFTKLDKNFCESSILAHGPEVAGIWAYLLAAAGSSGSVTATVPAMAGVFRTTEERIMSILTILEQPDPWSRTPGNDGRRIRVEREPEWQIVLLNHGKYRDKDHTAAERQRRYRERHREQAVTSPVTVSRRYTRNVTQAEAYTDTDTKEQNRRAGVANPLIAGRRPEVEKEGYRLIREIAELEPELDPTEVLLEAAGWKDRQGNMRTKVRLETMSDDHLIRTVHDLRSIRDDAKGRHGTQAPKPSI